MKVSVRSYLIAGLAAASTAVAPLALPMTPYVAGIASAQPSDDGSANQTDQPGRDRDGDAPRTRPRSSVGSSNDDSDGSAVAGQSRRGTRSAVSGGAQASTDGQGAAGRQSSRVTGTPTSSRATNEVRSFGSARNRVTVTANGSVRAQSATPRSVTRVSATSAAAADSASAPSPGRTINAAVQRALAGQTSATAHARANPSTASGATVSTERATTGIRAAQPARSSSPYAGNR